MELDKETRRRLSHIDIDPTWAYLDEERGRQETREARRLARVNDYDVKRIKGTHHHVVTQCVTKVFKCKRLDGKHWVTCFEHPDIELCRKMLKLNPEWRKAW